MFKPWHGKLWSMLKNNNKNNLLKMKKELIVHKYMIIERKF